MPTRTVRFFEENNLLVLLIANSFLFWLLIQAFRSIPFTPDFIIQFALIILFALVLELFFSKRFLNLAAMKLSIIAFLASIVLFYTLQIPLFIVFVFLSYAWFFPEFFREATHLSEGNNSKIAFYVTTSLFLAFFANIVERMIIFSFNYIIILIAGSTIGVIVLLFVKTSRSEDHPQPSQIHDKFSISKQKSRFFSGIATILTSCVLSVQLVVFNNPTVISVTSNSSYDCAQFITLISGAMWITIMVAFGKKIQLKKKIATIEVVALNVLVILPFVVAFFVWNSVNLIFFGLSNAALLSLLMLLLANLKNGGSKISFVFSLTGNLILYFLCSYFGIVLFFVLINCLTLLGGFLIIIVGYKNQFQLSFDTLNFLKSKKIAAVGIILLIVLSAFPLLKATLQNNEKTSYDKKVLAFYYPWYGNTTDYTNKTLDIDDAGGEDWMHWYDINDNYAATDTPLYGLYDSNDPELIKKHLELANKAGIDALICSWWGIDHYTDKAFQNLLSVAENVSSDVKFTIYYETSDQRFLSLSSREIINTISSEITYILEEYSDSSYFFTTEEKPVVFVYSTLLYSPLMWESIIQKVKEKNDCFLIADVFPVPEVKTEILSRFDGIHTYNPTFHICEQRRLFNTNDTYGTLKEMYFSMRDIARSYGKLWAGTTLAGYDDRIIRRPGMCIDRNDGDTYDDLWDLCIDAEADWVLITSFNEWHEGTEIEPSEEYGDLFIHRTNYWANKFKD